MKDFFGLFFKLYWESMIDGPPLLAVIPVTVCVVAPAGALYWLFVLDAFRRMRYAIAGNESRGTRPFVFFPFGPSFVLGAISHLQTTGWTLGVDSYVRYRGGGDGALLALAYVVPGLILFLVFCIGMALSVGWLGLVPVDDLDSLRSNGGCSRRDCSNGDRSRAR